MDSDTIKACHRAEIFEQVIPIEIDHREDDLKEKISLFFKMLLYAIVGKQKRLCKQIIIRDSPVPIEDYDIVVVASDHAILTGALVQNASAKSTVILEDGRADYMERKWSNIWKNKFTPYEIEGFFWPY